MFELKVSALFVSLCYTPCLVLAFHGINVALERVLSSRADWRTCILGKLNKVEYGKALLECARWELPQVTLPQVLQHQMMICFSFVGYPFTYFMSENPDLMCWRLVQWTHAITIKYEWRMPILWP